MNEEEKMDRILESIREMRSAMMTPLDNMQPAAPPIMLTRSEQELETAERDGSRAARYLENLERASNALVAGGRNDNELLDAIEAGAHELIALRERAKALRVAIAIERESAREATSRRFAQARDAATGLFGAGVPVIEETIDPGCIPMVKFKWEKR